MCKYVLTRLLFPQQVPTEEVSSMAMMKIPAIETFGPKFDSFDFAPRTIPESHTVMVSWPGVKHRITHSYGKLAWCKTQNHTQLW